MLKATLHLLQRFVLAAAYILVVVALAWFALHNIYPGDSRLPVRMISYLTPWLFMALIPGAIAAWLARRRWLFRVSLMLLALFFIMYWPIWLPGQTQVYAGSNTGQLKVMTFNVNFANRNAQGIAKLIEIEQPDLIAFQEMTDDLFAELYPKIEISYPHYLVDNSWDLPMVLVSRYPLRAQPKPARAIRAQHAAGETSHGTVVIWNVHPNPVITTGWESQRELLNLVAEDVALEKRPVLVLGDFNTTNQTDNYRLIADQLVDVHWAVDRGFGFTWPDLSKADTPDRSWPLRLLLKTGPVLGIDHIFASEHFIPQESYVVPHAYDSDHRPVVAELLWRERHPQQSQSLP